MDRVIFDMKNQNSLISLAYIKVSDNPLRVFCNYILFLLMKEPKKELRADILKEKLLQEFGLSMPQQLINNCVRILEKQGEVIRLAHGAGYCIGNTNFDIDAFERIRIQLHEHEEVLLKSLIEFVVDRYNVTWSKENARQHLSYFLDNILRKGDYTYPYGGKSRLPVFVTSNSKLAYTFRDYITESDENGKGWSAHALPVISDNMLLYRIWLPYATEFSDLPALTLSRFAYSAQSEGVVFFEEFRKVAAGLDRIRNVDLISTTEATRRKLEDILIRETNGELDQMTSEVVATSFDECVRMKHIDLVEENRDLNERAEAREAQVIRLLARDYVNKLGWFRVLLLAAKYWWLLGFGILFAVTTIISDNVYLRSISMMPILIQVVQFGLDKFVDDRGLRYRVYDRTLSYVKRKYSSKISRKVVAAGYDSDKDAVIDYCVTHTPVFDRLKE